MNNQSRRSLIIKAFVSGFGILVFPWRLFADALPDLKESDKLAKDAGYKADANKVDTKKFPKRAKPENKADFCHNCMFFTAEADGKKGTCQLFAGKLVSSHGWCNNYVKKP